MAKKLVIKDAEFGKVPYGYGNGMSSLAIYFGEEDGEYTYKAPEVEGKTFVEEEIVAHGLMMDLIDILKKKNLENRWSEVLLARNWVYFVGESLASPEHRKFSVPFLELVDKLALDVQVKVIKDRVLTDADDENTKAEIMKHIQSPLTAFVGEPKYFTGKEDFYQRFRTILCKYSLADDAEFNQMACVEIGNHNFASVVFDIKDFAKEGKIIEDRYQKIDAVTVSNDRVYVVDHKGDVELAKYAIDKGYRLNRALDYEGLVLKF